MDFEVISDEEFEEATKSAQTRGQLQELLNEIVANGQPVRVPRKTKGQVSALVRAAKDRGLTAVGDYKKLYVYIKP